MPARNYICPVCHQKTGVDCDIDPSFCCDSERIGKDGRVILGDSCNDPMHPDRRCTACGHTWHIKRQSFAEIPPEAI